MTNHNNSNNNDTSISMYLRFTTLGVYIPICIYDMVYGMSNIILDAQRNNNYVS